LSVALGEEYGYRLLWDISRREGIGIRYAVPRLSTTSLTCGVAVVDMYFSLMGE
jgi:hypothetical protein